MTPCCTVGANGCRKTPSAVSVSSGSVVVPRAPYPMSSGRRRAPADDAAHDVILIGHAEAAMQARRAHRGRRRPSTTVVASRTLMPRSRSRGIARDDLLEVARPAKVIVRGGIVRVERELDRRSRGRRAARARPAARSVKSVPFESASVGRMPAISTSVRGNDGSMNTSPPVIPTEPNPSAPPARTASGPSRRMRACAGRRCAGATRSGSRRTTGCSGRSRRATAGRRHARPPPRRRTRSPAPGSRRSPTGTVVAGRCSVPVWRVSG